MIWERPVKVAPIFEILLTHLLKVVSRRILPFVRRGVYNYNNSCEELRSGRFNCKRVQHEKIDERTDGR